MTEGAPRVVNMNEHLKGGVKPIFACVGTNKDFADFSGYDEMIGEVEYIRPPENLSSENILHGGPKRYNISPINEMSKVSNKFLDCTGLIVSGVDKETGKEISFLSHQDPTRVLYEKKEIFVSDLQERLVGMKNRCVPGTIDAVVVGGKYFSSETVGDLRENYLNSLNLLSVETKKTLGFEPVVINGPKISSGGDDCLYDTEHRRLYFVRPDAHLEDPQLGPSDKTINLKAKDFVPSEVDKHKDSWKQ